MTRDQADLTIRQATADDYSPTENLTRDSFWNIYKPGCDEHFMLHKKRSSTCYIPELDIVAFDGSDLVGHVICTRAVVKEGANESEVLCLGPITKAKELGFAAIIVFGDPFYYHRFGFKNTEEHRITTQDGQNFDPFMLSALDEEK